MDACVRMREAWLNFLYVLKLLLHGIIELMTPLKKKRQNKKKRLKLSYFEAVLKQNVDLGGNRAEVLEKLKTDKNIYFITSNKN